MATLQGTLEMVNFSKQHLPKENLQFPNNLLSEHFRRFDDSVMGVDKETNHPNTVKEISSLQDVMGAFRCIYLLSKLLEMLDWRKFFGILTIVISKN